jgi:hypothetical protein
MGAIVIAIAPEFLKENKKLRIDIIYHQQGDNHYFGSHQTNLHPFSLQLYGLPQVGHDSFTDYRNSTDSHRVHGAVYYFLISFVNTTSLRSAAITRCLNELTTDKK